MSATRGRIFQITPDTKENAKKLIDGLARASSDWKALVEASGFLLANIILNTFSFLETYPSSWPMSAAYAIAGVNAFGTLVSNFFARTHHAINIKKVLQLSKFLKKLDERLEARIRERKAVSTIGEVNLVFDEDEIFKLKEETIELDFLWDKTDKLYLILQLLANKYQVTISAYTPDFFAEAQVLQPDIFLCISNSPSTTMQSLMPKTLFPYRQICNYQSYFATVYKKHRAIELVDSFFKFILLKGGPSFVLACQGPTSLFPLLQRMGFDKIPGIAQLSFFSFVALWLIVSRVDVNNELKGGNAYAVWDKLICHTFFKNKTNQNNKQRQERQVGKAKAVGIAVVGIFVVFLTLYYNLTAALVYSPHKVHDILKKLIKLVPQNNRPVEWLKFLGKKGIYLLDPLYYLQIITTVFLTLLTIGSSTFDYVCKKIYEKIDVKKFSELSLNEILFKIGVILDSLAFAVNAAYNSNKSTKTLLHITDADTTKSIGIFSGAATGATNILWSAHTFSDIAVQMLPRCKRQPPNKYQLLLNEPSQESVDVRVEPVSVSSTLHSPRTPEPSPLSVSDYQLMQDENPLNRGLGR